MEGMLENIIFEILVGKLMLRRFIGLEGFQDQVVGNNERREGS